MRKHLAIIFHIPVAVVLVALVPVAADEVPVAADVVPVITESLIDAHTHFLLMNHLFNAKNK